MRNYLAAAALSLALLLTACSPGLSSTGEPLTVEQSERMAAARFGVYAKGEFTVSVSFLDEDDVDHVSADLTVDPSTHRAWGELHRGPKGIAVTEPVLVVPGALVVQRDGVWRESEVSSAAALAVQIVFSLAADRPENASLLRQTDAVYLGTTTVDGDQLEVYRVPSNESEQAAKTRLWLTPKGELRRMDSGDQGALEVVLTDASPTPQPADATEVWSELEG